MSATMGSTNTVLQELRAAVAKVDDANEELRKKRTTYKRAETSLRTAETSVYAAERDRDRLREAADVLSDDWRQWPWVMEDGFASKVPSL